jgi:hypothetical protein
VEQLGSASFDEVTSMVWYGDTLILAGGSWTSGALGLNLPGAGVTPRVDEQSFVEAMDSSGTVLWAIWLGDEGAFDEALAVAANDLGIFVVGQGYDMTTAMSPLATMIGNTDNTDQQDSYAAHIAWDYDPMSSPALDWIYQFGTSGYDSAEGVAIDGTRLFIVGRQDADPADLCVSPDAFPAGLTPDDAYVAEYDLDPYGGLPCTGAPQCDPTPGLWRRIGSCFRGDTANGVALGDLDADGYADELYVVGSVNGAQVDHTGYDDHEVAYLAAFDISSASFGALLDTWMFKVPATNVPNRFNGVTFDGGVAYAAGETGGDIDGAGPLVYQGLHDALLVSVPRP